MTTTQQVWDDLGQALRGYFARRLADPHTADDLTQEAFLRIHRSLHTLEDRDRLGPWVFRIARNLLTDHLRRRRPAEALDDTATAPSEDGDREDLIRIGRCLRSMTRTLPRDYREAIEAVEVHGQSQVDYAAAAGLSVSGAKSRVQRGRQKLKDELLACCRFELDRFGTPTGGGEQRCARECGCDHDDS